MRDDGGWACHNGIARMTLVLLVVVQESTCVPTCPGLGSLRCDSGLDCYSLDDICDGDPKCLDGSDEKDCHLNETACALIQQVFCTSTHACVKTWQDCDFNCPEASPHPCESNNECFADNQRCNRLYDCSDESDERNCTPNGPILDWKVVEENSSLNLPALFTILGPLMGGTAVMLFVCRVRASLRASEAAENERARPRRPSSTTDVEPVFYMEGVVTSLVNMEGVVTPSVPMEDVVTSSVTMEEVMTSSVNMDTPTTSTDL